MEEPISEITIDPVDIEGSNESKNVVKDLANDTEAITNSKKNVKESDVKSRFNKLNDNSKEC